MWQPCWCTSARECKFVFHDQINRLLQWHSNVYSKLHRVSRRRHRSIKRQDVYQERKDLCMQAWTCYCQLLSMSMHTACQLLSNRMPASLFGRFLTLVQPTQLDQLPFYTHFIATETQEKVNCTMFVFSHLATLPAAVEHQDNFGATSDIYVGRQKIYI